MYEVIKKSERKIYSYDELKRLLDGKWLYLTNTHFSEQHKFIKGVLVVIADAEFEGYFDGIYFEFDKPEYGVTADINLTDDIPEITSVLWSEEILAR